MSKPDPELLKAKMAAVYTIHPADNTHLTVDLGKQNDKFIRHLGITVKEKRVPIDYCDCGSCALLPYDAMPREQFCCRETLVGSNRWCKNLANVMRGHNLDCIVNWESFRKGIDKEILSSLIQQMQRLKKEKITKKTEISNRQLRYAAASSYTALIHGDYLGSGVRIELPSCVRNEIITLFPDENSEYYGFEAVDDEFDNMTQDNI